MSKLVFSLISVILAGVIAFSAGSAILNGGEESVWSFLFTSSNTAGLKTLLAERQSTNEAIANAEKIKSKIADLEKAQSEISQTDLDKLSKFIPNHIDNVNLIIDVNNIAVKDGLVLKNVKVQSGELTAGGNAVLASGGPTPDISVATMDFSVTGSYDNFQNFLDDLANSLRVIDPVKLAFSIDEKGLSQYNFEIKTYWVK